MGRVRYGFSQLHSADATEDDTTGAITYATPTQIPGAKRMTATAQGDSFNEPADNVVWYGGTTNGGYEIEIEFEDTAAADAFLASRLGHTTDANGILEKATDIPQPFALLGQMELAGGTETGKRVVFYRCVASRPNIEANTIEPGTAPTIATNVVTVRALPRVSDTAVKRTCVSTDTGYSTFFDSVVN